MYFFLYYINNLQINSFEMNVIFFVHLATRNSILYKIYESYYIEFKLCINYIYYLNIIQMYINFNGGAFLNDINNAKLNSN